MRIVALIPARSQSKGVKDKNMTLVRGRTLIQHAIDLAKDVKSIDQTYISTDSARYEAHAIEHGALSLGLRPEHLASDTAKSKDVVLDFLASMPEKPDVLVLLQPTTPIRSALDLEEGIRRLLASDADAAVSVSRFEEPHPFKMKKINADGFLVPFIDGTDSEVPRQSLEPCYRLNGAFYIVRTSAFLQWKSFFPPKTLPLVTADLVNIDSPRDLEFLNWHLQQTPELSVGQP